MKNVKLTKIQAQCLVMAAEIARKSDILNFDRNEKEALAEGLVKLHQAFRKETVEENEETNE